MAKLVLLFAILSAALITGNVWAKAVIRQSVRASCFAGWQGNRSHLNLNDGNYYYAELSKNPAQEDFSALGVLPNGHRLRITLGNKSIIATKGNVGRGGPMKPKIDIHLNAVKALGFTSCRQFGIRSVIIESA